MQGKIMFCSFIAKSNCTKPKAKQLKQKFSTKGTVHTIGEEVVLCRRCELTGGVGV